MPISNDRKSTRGTNIMATYIVFTRESTQDQNELNIYLSKVGEHLEGHPVKLHAGPQQVLEGPAPEFFVILEFPTTTAARKWYDGPAYQAIVNLKIIASTGSVNASIDLTAAGDQGIAVVYTGYSSDPTIEFTW